MNDAKYALRQLERRPGSSVVVVLMLALGLGATTAMFSMFHQILVRPLPVPEPERLVNLAEQGPKTGSISCSFAGPCAYEYRFSYPMFRDLEARQSAFTGLAAHEGFDANLAYGERTQSGLGLLVSGSYFGVLNLEPALGRLIAPQDEPRVGESAVVVLSHDYWQSHFGADPGVLGTVLTVNGQPLTVIGVAPAGFAGTIIERRPQVFVPLTLRWLVIPTLSRDDDNRQSYWLSVFARLKPQASAEQASAAINVLHRAILDEVEAPLTTSIPEEQSRQRRLELEPGAHGHGTFSWGAEQPLTLLLGITLLVLLIVCVNVANLLLARGASRAGEIAIRASIGASRRHLVLQLLAELGMLAGLGAIIAVPVAALTLGALASMMPEQLADGLAVALDPKVTAFAVGASLVTVLLVGLAPALGTTRADLGLVLKGHASQSPGGRGIARFRAALVTAQIALSMLLLVLAGLFAQSLANVARVNLGIDMDSLLSFQVSPRLNGYNAERAAALYDRIEEELAAQPGVRSVASASIPLIADRMGSQDVSLENFEPSPDTDSSALFNMIGSGFFDTLAIPLLAGRDFTAADTSSSARVAVVNESFARRFGLGENALGRRFRTAVTGETEIVGVVADAKYASVTADVGPQFFVPRRQVDRLPWSSFYVRADIEPTALMRMIPRIVSSLDPSLPVSNLTTMERQVEDNVYIYRLIAMLSVGFAGLATLLAAVGLYGVLAYTVTQRTRELGLRLALGAEPGTLRAMVLKQVALMGLAGGVTGLVAAIGLGRITGAMLFGLTGYDPFVLVAAVIVLSVVVLGASYWPARRASSVAPMEALRYE